MLANFGGWHFVAILLIVLLLFGATRLPALARSVGQSVKILKKESRPETADAEGEGENVEAPAAAPTTSAS